MAEATLSVDNLCKAFDSLSKDFFNPTNKTKYENYIGLEDLSKEFLHLNLPKASDILNVASGPGILSAYLQSHGYANIDAFDVNESNIKQLLPSGLYRNYICRPMGSNNSTGFKDDVYDAVVMLGGFSPGNISPSAMSEILRVTKPDGHILWTLRADYHRSDSEYGLMEESLLDMERNGECQVIKMGEKFKDRHSGLAGLLYVVVKKAEVEEPPESHVPPSILVDTVKAEAEPSATEPRRGSVARGAIAGHDQYAVGERTEGDMVVVHQYTGHVKLCQAFFKLRLPRHVEILDISSHMNTPGLVGLELSHNGYDFVDGLDHNLESLSACRAAKIYRNNILGQVGELGSIPVHADSYDVVLMAAGFAPGKIKPSAFHEIVRVVRPGGYILWTMRDGYGATDPDFALFDVRVQDLVLERKWDVQVGPVFFDNFENQHPGRFYMLRKCHREVFALGSPRHSPSSSPRLQRRRLSIK